MLHVVLYVQPRLVQFPSQTISPQLIHHAASLNFNFMLCISYGVVNTQRMGRDVRDRCTDVRTSYTHGR